ncbi:MAG: BatA domain-containing protein [Puniceicoccales bacterium]|jgi:hypothetical protein|nr:BatA domain-containing protein [Puniceicoccales bacterium]
MHVIFDNPAGLWALLGIPALLVIHILQARARRVSSSTLFLLDRLAPESRGGWQWERLRNSIPLWLQLLAVLVLAWVLTEPRWIRENASQQIIVVLDSSLSMDAALDDTRARLPARLRTVAALAMRTEWTLLESDSRAPVLYRGDSLDALGDALAKWRPALGEHDFSPVLQLATALARGHGAVVFVTDHAEEVSGGAAVLSFAKPRDNTGFVGSSVEETSEGVVWHALVRNHGATRRSLEWRVKAGERETQPVALVLAPGETQAIGGTLPPAAAATVLLAPDGFTLDDSLPLVRPRIKPVRVSLQISGPEREAVERVLRGVEGIQIVNTPGDADLFFAQRAPDGTGVVRAKPSVLFPAADSPEKPLEGWVVADSHALVSGVAWQGLICATATALPLRAEDSALVWRGDTPLVTLRQENPRPTPPSLFFNFHPSKTNALRLPAFVILLRRYIESIREALPGSFAVNADTHQRIPLAFVPEEGGLLLSQSGVRTPLTAAQAAVFRAPARPGFFQVMQGEKILLDGAAQFSDSREADLTRCGPVDTLAVRERALAHASSVPDPWRPFWLALLLALPLLAWVAGRSKE